MITDARTNSLRFAWVVPGVLAGCRRPETVADFKLLEEEGVATVISLLEYGGFPACASGFSFHHVHIPMLDGSAPRHWQLEKLIETVRTRAPAVVHCLAGIGRTGTMLVGYLVRSSGMLPVEAMRMVETSRTYSFQTSEQEDWEYSLIPRSLT